MKHKNGDLNLIIAAAGSIAKLRMPGILSLAVAKGRKKIVKGLETYSEARTQLLESRCKKDDKEKPIFQEIDEQGKDLVFKDDAEKAEYKGKILQKYTFETKEIEDEATAECKKLDEVEQSYELESVSAKVLEHVECSPADMDTILLFVEVK